MGTSHLPGTQMPHIGFASRGNSTADALESPSSTEALLPSAKLWNVEPHRQNRANAAASYHKGKPGPEDRVPQSLCTGNRGSILTASHTLVRTSCWRGGSPKQLVLCPLVSAPVHFHAQVYSKGNLILFFALKLGPDLNSVQSSGINCAESAHWRITAGYLP